jgi:uncharacterized protein (TIGR02453 family)
MATNMTLVLDFLKDIESNNNRAWFEANRARYEAAKAVFENFVATLIEEFGAFEDLGSLAPADCVMRIYRDVRFSKDKTPYRTNMAASIAPGGRKSMQQGYYMHLEPGGRSMLAGGLYMPTPQQLAGFRAAIDRDADAFRAVVAAPAFKKHFGSAGGERVKTAPQGYSRDHPEIELLRLKQVIAMHQWPDDEVTAPRFAQTVATAARALKPFLDYLMNVTRQEV